MYGLRECELEVQGFELSPMSCLLNCFMRGAFRRSESFRRNCGVLSEWSGGQLGLIIFLRSYIWIGCLFCIGRTALWIRWVCCARYFLGFGAEWG